MVDVLSNQTPPGVVVLRDHMAIDLVMNVESARRLAPFMREEQTLGTAAAELSMPPSSLAYWVKRFAKARLLVVVRHEARAGKPIPVYRASASEYHVPLDAMPPGLREDFFNSGRRHMFEEFERASNAMMEKYLRRGVRISAHPSRGVEINLLDLPTQLPVPVAESWSAISLTEEEARELLAELEALSNKYSTTAEGKGKKRYVMVLGLAPR